MKNYKNNYFISDNFDTQKIVYGFFSKEGGFSKNNYYSLNCSLSSGDSQFLVKKNIQIAKNNLNIKNKKIKFINQTHSSKVEIIDSNNVMLPINADGSITTNNKIALAVLTADCAPIFIFGTNFSFICALHVGWKGCFNNIIKCTVTKLKNINFSNQKFIAIVGPCLNKKYFEVDEGFKKKFIKKDLNYKKFFSTNLKYKKFYFDMRALINFQLRQSSVKQISNVDIDTYSNDKLFYSHRKSSHRGNLPIGRMINIISFKNNA